MKTQTYILPSFFASALINDDWTGLSDEDVTALNAFLDDNAADYKVFYCLSDGADKGFKRTHGMSNYGILASDCFEFIFQVG